MYKLFLITRYLSRRMLSLVAMVVLAFAVWTLVLAPSVMSGFQEEFHKRLRGTLSDLTIWSAHPFALSDDPEIEAYLSKLPNVEAVAPYIENPALDKHLRKIDYCFLRGIDPVKEDKVSRMREYLLSERAVYKQLRDYKLASEESRKEIDEIASQLPDTVDSAKIFKHFNEGHPDEPELPAVMVGVYYMKRWDLMLGDVIRLTTASEEGEVAQDKKYKIVGAFKSGHHDTDRRIILMSLKNAQRFINVPGKVTGYSLRLSDYKQAPITKKALQKDIRNANRIEIPLPILEGYYIKTWEERNQNLLKAVAMEKLLIRIMTGLIVVAASASIFLVMFMTVHSKVRELGILRAVGATRSGVLSLFVGQGFVIALVAMLIGLGMGFWTGQYINEIADGLHKVTGWHPFPPEIYYLDRIPVKFDMRENMVNFTMTLVMGSLAAFIPGLLAALRPPLKSIRYE